MANLLYSQVALHADYGGVVPELASRDHVRKTLPMIKEAMEESGTASDQVAAIAYTRGPGLVGALMVGAAIAKSLAMAWNVPALGIHHMEGHLLAALMDGTGHSSSPEFPFTALLVSGGHTQLMSASGLGHYRLLGESMDDAAGEAFDKAAKMLDLGYPGGPEIARAALQGQEGRFKFPRPMTDRPGLDFSFSGLKTYTMNCIAELKRKENTLTDQDRSDVALAFETAVVETLTIKCRRALEETGLNQLVIAGGVSANVRLRQSLEEMAKKLNASVIYPDLKFCTDNGAMIAYAGYLRYKLDQKDDLSIQVKPRWPMDSLSA